MRSAAIASLFGALLAGCGGQKSDPPPPPTRTELVTAPPGALGAHAAGTDASVEAEELRPSQPGAPEGGAEPPDAGTPPASPPPDAGTAL